MPGDTGTHRAPRATPHRVVDPTGAAPAVGFAHAVVAGPGRTVYLGGQTAQRPDGSIAPDSTLVEQFTAALGNVAAVLEAAGALPEHLVSCLVYATDAAEYRRELKALGRAWRERFGRHYPAMAFFEVAGLFDPAAKVELVCTAVVPPDDTPDNTADDTAAPPPAP